MDVGGRIPAAALAAAALTLIALALLSALPGPGPGPTPGPDQGPETGGGPPGAAENSSAPDNRTELRSLDYYALFLDELTKPRYLTMTHREFALRVSQGWEPPGDRVVVLIRHDVDHDPETALEMAEMERERNLTASYYFRVRADDYNALSERVSSIIREISSWGFEVGLHYEDLYAANYSVGRAVELLRLDLQIIRSVVPTVDTACAHGNRADMPVTNDRIFELSGTDPSDFGLVAECYNTVLPLVRRFQHRYVGDNMGRAVDWIREVRNAEPGWIEVLLIHPCYYARRGGPTNRPGLTSTRALTSEGSYPLDRRCPASLSRVRGSDLSLPLSLSTRILSPLSAHDDDRALSTSAKSHLPGWTVRPT